MKKTFGAIFFGFICGFFVLAQVSAAAFSGEGLTISPPLSEPNIKPGETLTQTITLTNPTDKIVEVYPQTLDFKAGGDGGQPAFIEKTEGSYKYSLASWISFNPAKIALTPEQVYKFSYKITVPTDAEPGGHYGAMFFLSEPPKNNLGENKVSIGSMVGSLILVKVPGDIVEKGSIQSFETDQLFYVTQKAAGLVTKISNTGNIHIKPTGTIEVKNFFGKTVATIEFNNQNGNVLPDSTRKFVDSWSFKWYQVGYFKANEHILYGTGQQPLEASVGFWYLPIWFLVVLAAALVLIISLIVFVVTKVKKNRAQRKPKEPQAPQGPPVLR